MQDRRTARADLKFDRPRIGKLLGQRNFIPAKARPAHIDRESPSPARQHGIGPAAVSKVSAALPVVGAYQEATQRMPLPQAPASEPSLL